MWELNEEVNIFIPFIKTLLILKTDKKDIDVPADIPEDEEFDDEGKLCP